MNDVSRLMYQQKTAEFIEEMVVQHQFDQQELKQLLNRTHHIDSAIQLMRPAPLGIAKNWTIYRSRFIEPIRIKAGIQFWRDHFDILERAFIQYGVPPEIIVGILGVETIYGRDTGHFRVVDVLMTLSFDYPESPNRLSRMRYFRGELEQVLLLAREQNIDPLSLQGSYAGAIGWPQFMPSTIRKYSVDFDQDGKIDLRAPADAIGSVAHFLAEHGWQSNAPLVIPAVVDGEKWPSFVGQNLSAQYSLDALHREGIHPSVTPPDGQLWGLVDLQNGVMSTEYWLGAPNFFVVTRYNRSFFYAMSVIELGHQICVRGDFKNCFIKNNEYSSQ